MDEAFGPKIKRERATDHGSGGGAEASKHGPAPGTNGDNYGAGSQQVGSHPSMPATTGKAGQGKGKPAGAGDGSLMDGLRELKERIKNRVEKGGR